MGRPERYGDPRGNTAPRGHSPLPQEAASGGSKPVRITSGFTQFLPGRTVLFFQRKFFQSFPRPIQIAGQPSFPRIVPIATINAPQSQSIVVKSVGFKAYQHSGIGLEDIIEVPQSRTVSYLGFSFSIGNRGIADFSTNLTGAGVPLTPVVGPQAGVYLSPQAGQGSVHPGTGTITPAENFAAYAKPGQQLKADAWVFRPPNFDARLLEVSLSGWLANEADLERILDSLSR